MSLAILRPANTWIITEEEKEAWSVSSHTKEHAVVG